MLVGSLLVWATVCAQAAQPAGAEAFPALATPQTQAVLSIAAGSSPTILRANPSSTIDGRVSGATGSGQGLLDMTTGLLRAQSSGSFGFSNSIAGWDFLQFNGSGNVSYAFDVDGGFSNRRSAGFVYADVGVRLYDVTDWTSYFALSSGIQFVSRNGDTSPFDDIVVSSFERVGVRGASAATCAAIAVTGLCTTNSNGSLVPVDFSLSGSASVEAGRLYLLELVLNLNTLNGASSNLLQTANFADTAAFTFTDLGGLSFSSSSGQFLAAVPEPQTWALWAGGLLALGMVRRRKSLADGKRQPPA